MPRLEPPGWPWLLAFELRLLWRGFGLRSKFLALLAFALLVLMHAAGWGLWRSGTVEHGIAAAPAAFALLSVVVLLLVLSSAFALAVRTLFERSDLDLLLSAPVPVAHVFTTRGLAVAAGAVAPMGFFLLPIADMGPVVGHWGALAAWPALLLMGMACAAVAFAGTLGLVRLLGVRRARLAAQLMGAFIGAALVLAMQVHPLLPRAMRDWIAGAFSPMLASRLLASDGPLLWPLRAMLGEPLPFALLAASSLAAFALVMRIAARGFARAVQDAPASAASSRSRAARGAVRFREGLARIVIRKELLLLARDPMLIGKSLVQVLYLVPLFIVMVRRGRAIESLAAVLVLLCASIGATLAWISVSGEEAPELLRGAPVPMARLRRLKVVGAVLPVTALAAPFIAWYALQSLAAAAIVTAYLAAAVCSSAAVQVWGTQLGAGRDLKARRSQTVILRLVDNVAMFGWAGACYGTLLRSPWALLGILVGGLGPGAAAIAAHLREREA